MLPLRNKDTNLMLETCDDTMTQALTQTLYGVISDQRGRRLCHHIVVTR